MGWRLFSETVQKVEATTTDPFGGGTMILSADDVDEVDILAINKVTISAEDGFVADAVWTVSGSVSHFGHTYYRRNKNHALVTFVMDDDSWKIKDIELIDEKRLL